VKKRLLHLWFNQPRWLVK